MTTPKTEQAVAATAPNAPDPSAAFNAVQQVLEKLTAAATVTAVYGEPVTQGANMVIPAAEVLSAAGFGMGSGGASSEGGQDQGSGSGGGGGGRVLSRPVAAIIFSEQGVRVEPIVDVTKVALAALTAAGFMAGMLLRMRARRLDVGA